MHILSRFALALVAALFISVTAQAEGIAKGKSKVAAAVQDPAPAAAPTTSWTGCYAGAAAGMMAGVHDSGFGVDGYLYGLNGGCDVQMGRLVVGAFGSYDWLKADLGGATVDATQWSLGGRGGVLVTDTTLLYALAARPTLRADALGGSDLTGLSLGGGIETILAPQWSAKLEYQRSTFDDLPDAREHAVRFGFAYRFNVPALNFK